MDRSELISFEYPISMHPICKPHLSVSCTGIDSGNTFPIPIQNMSINGRSKFSAGTMGQIKCYIGGAILSGCLLKPRMYVNEKL